MGLKRGEEADQIKARMVKEATRIYENHTGKKLNSLDAYDPLVHMLLGACASEFEMVSQEIKSSWSRMLEQIAHLLTPEVHTGPKPSHGIAHARASGFATTTNLTDQLFLNDHQGKEIYFTPAGQYQLFDLDVKYIASGKTLYQLNDINHKEPLLRATGSSGLPNLTLWIGIEASKYIKTLENFSFYVDWKSENQLKHPEDLTQNLTWYHNNQFLKVSPGLKYVEEGNTSLSLSDELHTARAYEREINLYHEQNFVRLGIADELPSIKREHYPEEFLNFFSASDLGKLSDPLIWMKLEISPAFFPDIDKAETILTNAIILTNCFPVLNRKLETVTKQLSQKVNIFPLETDRFYFTLEKVFSTRTDRSYQQKPFMDIYSGEAENDQEVRIFSLRKEGVNRFNHRDAGEVLRNMLKFFREETFIFSALGKNVVSSNIAKIEDSLNDLESKLGKHSQEPGSLFKDKESKIFAAFPPSKRENVIIQFWSTDGFSANHTAPGSLEMEGSLSWRRNSVKLLSSTILGRDPLSDTGRLHEFKSALIARNRIITHEDIKAVCMAELRDFSPKSIQIKRGVILGTERSQGLMRCLDIHVVLDSKQNSEYIQQFLKKLEVKLNHQSSSLLPIRVLSANYVPG